jgi:putative intracellular protease/amidase
MKLVPVAEVPQVGVLLAPNADLLSITVPLGVFAGSGAVRAFTVADARAKFRAGDALDMTPQFTFAEAPALDVLVVPATFGLFGDELVLEYLRAACARARFVLAIDAGALLLAQAGLLDGATVPGNRFIAERAKETARKTTFDAELRSARHGKFLIERDARGTMDAVLEILGQIAGAGVAERTALELGLGEER